MARRLTNEERDLVELNLDVAERIALHMITTSQVLAREGYDEVYQWAVEGLMDAARSWDPSRGTSFGTYAWGRARGNILDHLRKMVGRNGEKPRMFGFSQHTEDEDENIPHVAENRAYVTTDYVRETVCGEDFISHVLQSLKPKERAALTMRMDGHTMKEIGQALRVSASRVCQIFNELKEQLGRRSDIQELRGIAS